MLCLPSLSSLPELLPVLAELHIRSEIVAAGPRLGRFASPITFGHNLLHHSQERIGPCGKSNVQPLR